MYDVIIIGGGPAGLTAAIYASRAHLSTLVLEPELDGGQMALSMSLENFPGVLAEDTGMDIGLRMAKQAASFGAKTLRERVISVTVEGDKKSVTTETETYEGKYVIVATGSKPNRLGVPGEETFVSRGVSYCATCDGAFYQDGDVYVVGGGNSAVEEALYLANLGAKVTIIHRRDTFRAESFLAKKAVEDENIAVLWNTELKEVVGENVAEGLVLYNNKTKETYTVQKGDRPLGVFIYVGVRPQTAFLEGLLEMHDGYVDVDENQMTAVDGIYAAGDIVNKQFRQVINACGEGCVAAMAVAKRIVQYD
ncbi:MAG: thioredoxin-disulfide reductase [Peptoniphilus sp.]|nr:thioredoxin-disulfide reductase [Peptoniphilus sp.]MDY3118741.1 thioredoxin-disulfide reductase [Peptoniphilus sp.]